MLKIDDTIDQILNGVHEANKKFLEMSGGATVQEYGIEPFISVGIDESLYQSALKRGEVGHVTLENPCWELVTWALGEEYIDHTEASADGQRVDVAYWNKHDLPEGVVEVKRQFSFSNCAADIEKIAKLLSRLDTQSGGTLKWGAIAAMRERTAASRKERSEVLEDFLAKCENSFPHFTFKGRSREVLTIQGAAITKRREDLVGFEAYAVLFRRKKE